MITTSVIEKNFDLTYSLDECHKAIELIIPKFIYICHNSSKATNYYRIGKSSGLTAVNFDVTFKIIDDTKTNLVLNCIIENRIRNLQNQIIENFIEHFTLALEGKIDELNEKAQSDSASFFVWIFILLIIFVVALIIL